MRKDNNGVPQEEVLENLVKAVAEQIKVYHVRVKANKKARATRWANLIESNGAEPTESASGTLHAPHDGYVWEWYLLNSDGDIVQEFEATFMGGEFLPETKTEKLGSGSGSKFNNLVYRIDYVEADLANQIIKAFEGILGMKTGKVFESRGVNTCHLYVAKKCVEAAKMVEKFIMAPRIEAANAEEAKRQAEIDAAEPCPIGRVAITGEVLSTKWQDSAYGGALKMLVKDDRGFKVWGSVPNSMDPNRGDRITFMAGIEPSQDDEKFGFFKRPTKAKFLDKEVA